MVNDASIWRCRSCGATELPPRKGRTADVLSLARQNPLLFILLIPVVVAMYLMVFVVRFGPRGPGVDLGGGDGE